MQGVPYSINYKLGCNVSQLNQLTQNVLTADLFEKKNRFTERSRSISGKHAEIHVIKFSLHNVCQNVHLHILDMSRPREVSKFATDFANSGQPLHVLVSAAHWKQQFT